MSLVAAAFLVVFTSRTSTAATIFVDVDAAPGGDGSSWATALADLQDALALAVSGDEVWVAEGVYLPSSSLDREVSFSLVDGVRLYGGFDGTEAHRSQRDFLRNPTTLSGELSNGGEPYISSRHVVLADFVGSSTTLDGFIVRGGRAAYPPEDHEARSGAGLLVRGGAPVVRNVTFVDNDAEQGGGMAVLLQSAPHIASVVFRDNQASGGAGLHVSESSPRIEDVVFSRNCSTHLGALSLEFSSPTLRRVSFEDNTGVDGVAGLYSYGGAPIVVDSHFARNVSRRAGAIHGQVALVVNTLFVGNRGGYGGVYWGWPSGSVKFVNVTMYDNRDAHSWSIRSTPGGVELYNVILWEAELEGWGGEIFPQSVATARNSIFGSSAGYEGIGDDQGILIDADPRFVDATGSDLRLSFASPALESGTDPTPYLPAGFVLTTDLDGNPRVSGYRIDIGAYEYQFDGCPTAQIEIGPSWDGIHLQDIFDATYGPGAIDAATDYSGFTCGDPLQAYWLDANVDAWIVREIASNGNANVFGWHAEDFASPVIDGVDDGVIFTGPIGEGASASVTFPSARRFGFYLDPNGPGDATNAPHPEHFFTNRLHNDAGPDGRGAAHQPFGGDVQCLIYDVSHLRGGVPTYVLAWEDFDAGSPLTATYTPTTTDNDFNDLVVEIRAESPVPAVVAQLRAQVRDRVVELQWELQGTTELVQYEIQRRPGIGAFETIALSTEPRWTDDTLTRPGRYEYRIAARFGTGSVYSQVTSVDFAPMAGGRSALLRAVPNPFNPSTRIEFVLLEGADATIEIFDLAGRRVRGLDLPGRSAGPGSIRWDGTDDEGRSVASGTYLVRLRDAGTKDALRIVLVK